MIAQLLASPAGDARPVSRREYIHHKTTHVAYLKTNYPLYTLAELEQQLAIPAAKIFELCRRSGIRKRAPNKQKPHNDEAAQTAD